jgi:hypothetical protein
MKSRDILGLTFTSHLVLGEHLSWCRLWNWHFLFWTYCKKFYRWEKSVLQFAPWDIDRESEVSEYISRVYGNIQMCSRKFNFVKLKAVYETCVGLLASGINNWVAICQLFIACCSVFHSRRFDRSSSKCHDTWSPQSQIHFSNQRKIQWSDWWYRPQCSLEIARRSAIDCLKGSRDLDWLLRLGSMVRMFWNEEMNKKQ